MDPRVLEIINYLDALAEKTMRRELATAANMMASLYYEKEKWKGKYDDYLDEQCRRSGQEIANIFKTILSLPDKSPPPGLA